MSCFLSSHPEPCQAPLFQGIQKTAVRRPVCWGLSLRLPSVSFLKLDPTPLELPWGEPVLVVCSAHSLCPLVGSG